MLRERIELSTSPLPRECSTTELPQRRLRGVVPVEAGRRLPQREGGRKPSAWRSRQVSTAFTRSQGAVPTSEPACAYAPCVPDTVFGWPFQRYRRGRKSTTARGFGYHRGALEAVPGEVASMKQSDDPNVVARAERLAAAQAPQGAGKGAGRRAEPCHRCCPHHRCYRYRERCTEGRRRDLIGPPGREPPALATLPCVAAPAHKR